jgi:hypothetical protein
MLPGLRALRIVLGGSMAHFSLLANKKLNLIYLLTGATAGG